MCNLPTGWFLDLTQFPSGAELMLICTFDLIVALPLIEIVHLIHSGAINSLVTSFILLLEWVGGWVSVSRLSLSPSGTGTSSASISSLSLQTHFIDKEVNSEVCQLARFQCYHTLGSLKQHKLMSVPACSAPLAHTGFRC